MNTFKLSHNQNFHGKEEMKGHRPTWLVFFCLFFISIRMQAKSYYQFFYKYTNIVKRELYKLVLNVKVVISQQQVLLQK